MTDNGSQAASHLHLESVPNVRDLGGYVSTDGRVTKRGIVFRAGTLRDVTADDVKTLATVYGWRFFFDLRSSEEIGAGPAAILGAAGIQWVHAPVAGHPPDRYGTSQPEWQDYVRSYVDTLDTAGTALRQIVTALISENIPLAFGCTLGKDRTGVIVALLLAALDIPVSTIATDYVATTCCLERYAPRLHWLAEAKGVSPAELQRRFRVVPDTIFALFDELRSRYGSVSGYLASAHIDDSMIRAARSRLLTEQRSRF